MLAEATSLWANSLWLPLSAMAKGVAGRRGYPEELERARRCRVTETRSVPLSRRAKPTAIEPRTLAPVRATRAGATAAGDTAAGGGPGACAMTSGRAKAVVGTGRTVVATGGTVVATLVGGVVVVVTTTVVVGPGG